MKAKSYRPMKVYETSGYHYKPTPTIVLKGQWLEQFGFGAGEKISVHCEEGKLTVTKIADNECEEN